MNDSTFVSDFDGTITDFEVYALIADVRAPCPRLRCVDTSRQLQQALLDSPSCSSRS
jgi:hypothetical protein